MGQTTAAVAVGIIPDKALWKEMMDDEGEHIWEAMPYKKHPECGEDHDCIAFAAAVLNGADDDDGSLRVSALLSSFADKYPKDVKRARKKWDTFAAWLLKKHDVTLPSPELLLMVTERA